MYHLQRTFDPIPQSVGQARGFVTSAIGCHVDTPRCDDIRSCVSELASNAILHTGNSGNPFVVRVSTDQHGCVRLEVHDQARDTGPVLADHQDTDATDGRGMLIVQLLSDDWGVDPSPTGKVVWSHFASAAQAAEHAACKPPTGPAARPGLPTT